jgi:hypothetical protein
MDDSSAHRHRIGRRVILPVSFIVGIAGWMLIASPPLERTFHDMQNCRPDEITEVRTYDCDSIYSGSSPTLFMRGNETAALMELMSKAEKVNPNHPRGGSTLFAEVDTTRLGTLHLRISGTDNCDVLIYIDSKRVGQEPMVGWTVAQ